MRRSVLLGLTVALLGACTGAAQAVSPSPTYHGGPVFSEYRTQEVVWAHEGKTAEGTITEGLAAFLGDVAAASGTTEDVFAMLPQYSTQGLTGGSQIAAYHSSYLGRATVAPTSSAALTTTQLATDLNQEITAGALPAPGLDAGGAANTVYVVVLPANMEACEGSECSGPSKTNFCSLRGIAHYNSTPYAFILMPDLSGALGSGCGGTPPAQLEKETSTVTQQLGETITDAFNVESKEAWMNSEFLGVGYICNGENATNTINGHTWTVQKLWSNIDNACVGGDTYFHPPSADFTGTPTANSAAFSAHGSSTNKLGSIAAGIASYSWDFGDGQSGTGATPSHSYAAAGTYTVSVTATDTLG
ncbi:MAG TPA: PKD domain-containing protein, partial [Solirubrobacteraceae bacterium]